MSPQAFNDWLVSAQHKCLVMGVLNVTPDSFSDGGDFIDARIAIERARQMIDEGADIIDVGGESTRPGAQRVPADEQIRRVAPVIRGVSDLGITISIDTTLAPVACAALDAGASIVNDVSAGTEDARMVGVVAERNASVVLMHMQGSPGTMQRAPQYENVVDEVRTYLLSRAEAFASAGVAREKILLDPGIGFGKTVEHNLELLRHLSEMKQTPHRLLVGTSRKSFIGTILNQPDPSARLMGTAATVAWSVMQGADIVRVHDVAQMRDVVRMTQALLNAHA